MTRLRAIADKHDLEIIEDASHALGASWRDHRCGSLGDISVVSLQGDKLAPAGEGGMFLTRNDAYMERATCMGDIMRILQLQGPSQRFAGTSFGIKTRMAPLCAAVARTQLGHLPERMARRTQNLVYLSTRLEELGFDTFLAPPHVERVYFEFIVRYDEQRWVSPNAARRNGRAALGDTHRAAGKSATGRGLQRRLATLSTIAPAAAFHRRPICRYCQAR
jgi:dTDP-4-amino-4,6-dideoxygalactose transaminase